MMHVMERMKRTYNLRPVTVSRVRELAASYGSTSQDAVVELAVDRLYRESQEAVESERWAQAAVDDEFRSESRAIARAYGDRTDWPA